MIKSITVINNVGDSLKMELTRPEKSGFIVGSVDGLGPVAANINTTRLAMSDGVKYNSAYLNQRDIVLTLLFLDSKYETIEDMRYKSYKYFPVKRQVELIVETDKRVAKVTGIVESNEPSIFSANEGCTVTVSCQDPYFYSIGTIDAVFYGVQSMFNFPFNNDIYEPIVNKIGIDELSLMYDNLRRYKREYEQATFNVTYNTASYGEYDTRTVAAINEEIRCGVLVEQTESAIEEYKSANSVVQLPNQLLMGVIKNEQTESVYYQGDAEVGMTIRIHAVGDASNITIYNLTSGEKIRINFDMIEGDTILITSERGNKGITLIRDGESSNILNCLGKGTPWFTLVRGDNVFAYETEDPDKAMNLQFMISSRIAYDGV